MQQQQVHDPHCTEPVSALSTLSGEAADPVTQATQDPHCLVEDLWDEPAPKSISTGGPSAALQGVWNTVAGKRSATFLITGQHLTAHFADGAIYVGTFSLSTDGQLSAMDVQISEGPAPHRGRLARCIYEIDGDTLYWATTSPGQGDRPTSFDDKDPLHLSLVLRREGPGNSVRMR